MNTCTKVSLRQRPIKNGMISLYLDFYPAIRVPETNRMSRREYLGIYIYANPANRMQKEFNDDMLYKAEAIRCMRTQSVINEEFGFMDKQKMNGDFVAYFRNFVKKKDAKADYGFKLFGYFCCGHCKFKELNVSFCNRYRDYLLEAHQLARQDKPLNHNTACSYWRTFRSCLKLAHREKYIKENINEYLDSIDEKIPKKEFLTLEELKRLSRTPCDYPVLKAASLFSCLTGLRYSDVENLKWKNIEKASDGGYCLRITVVKTKDEFTLPISQEAYELCGVPQKGGKVFKGLNRNLVLYRLKPWLRSAGITKHITFHGFRHSFATLQVAAGTDIYTVSKMLNHKNVSTTQIYADLVSEKKRESANRISLK